ncbi:hypothetical protein JW935_13150 [candidate division KSB1 bacterium]|nr:hypothetical protein [candidate division KSB1 bacterium]
MIQRISLQVPGAGRRRLDGPEWEEYLTNPFEVRYLGSRQRTVLFYCIS